MGNYNNFLPNVPVLELFNFLGKVAYCLLISMLPPGGITMDLLIGITPGFPGGPKETTVISTRSPDFRIKSTTCSCEADDTSSLLISSKKSPFFKPAMSATPPGSTSSRYCRAGHFSDGVSSISGDVAFAPRSMKPKPFRPL